MCSSENTARHEGFSVTRKKRKKAGKYWDNEAEGSKTVPIKTRTGRREGRTGVSVTSDEEGTVARGNNSSTTNKKEKEEQRLK